MQPQLGCLELGCGLDCELNQLELRRRGGRRQGRRVQSKLVQQHTPLRPGHRLHPRLHSRTRAVAAVAAVAIVADAAGVHECKEPVGPRAQGRHQRGPIQPLGQQRAHEAAKLHQPPMAHREELRPEVRCQIALRCAPCAPRIPELGAPHLARRAVALRLLLAE